MAKRKVDRPKKKRKYVRKDKPNYIAGLTDSVASGVTDNYQATTSVQQRASDSSYVFVCGNKVLIQNLTDETLNERFEQAFISAYEARRLANQLEKLEYNLAMEQRYRGLK
jgi:hypothetical protein